MLSYHVRILLLIASSLIVGANPNVPMRPLMEICDNGIDDDADGLIDLNDDDCRCPIIEPVSLIPNPSFEEKICCPPARSSLHCAENWVQASDATTDYLHTCGWVGWNNLPVPMPFPDGEACIGFRNGRFGEENPNPNWKEYTGACLTEPLRTGNTYRFEFYVGFTQTDNSPPTTLAFFGSTSCDFLPFGVGDNQHGCPLNGPGWTQLDDTFISGSNEWKPYSFEITPSTDIYAIAIGPNCTPRTTGPNPYYFLDELVLADIREFEFAITPSENPCAEDFTLSLPVRDSLKYQWYLDGIALPNKKGPILQGELADGHYQVLITGPATCRLTKRYYYARPVYATMERQPLCPNSQFRFQDRVLDQSGTYRDTLTTADGCDSIVELVLWDAEEVTMPLHARIFPGENFQVGNRTFSQPTEEVVALRSNAGCDSLVDLQLTYYEVYLPNAFSPNGDGVNDVLQIVGGPELISVDKITVFNRWGGVVFGSDTSGEGDHTWDGRYAGQSMPPGTYPYMVRVTMDDQRQRNLSGVVHLIR